MNERIRLLADEATELDYETFDNFNHKTVQHYKFDKEKFAQLIVAECASRLVDMDQQVKGQHNYYKHASLQVMLHFGIQP